MTKVLTDTQPIRLKGRSFLALVLTPELPFDDWLVRLDGLAARSAGFFLHRPVVLEIDGLEVDRIQLRNLIQELGRRDVRVMGIEGAHPSLLGDDLPPAITGGLSVADVEKERSIEPVHNGPASALMLTQPVRSGQLVTSDGDITIVGSVASGAEVIAGGSVHVYGAIRGRIHAGSMGDTRARIFCRKLEAELIAIAGYYKTSEDLEPELRGQAVQLLLEGNSILGHGLT